MRQRERLITLGKLFKELSTLFVRQIKLPQVHFLHVHCKISHVIMHKRLVKINSARETDYVVTMSTVQDLSQQKGKKMSEQVIFDS